MGSRFSKNRSDRREVGVSHVGLCGVRLGRTKEYVFDGRRVITGQEQSQCGDGFDGDLVDTESGKKYRNDWRHREQTRLDGKRKVDEFKTSNAAVSGKIPLSRRPTYDARYSY